MAACRLFAAAGKRHCLCVRAGSHADPHSISFFFKSALWLLFLRRLVLEQLQVMDTVSASTLKAMQALTPSPDSWMAFERHLAKDTAAAAAASGKSTGGEAMRREGRQLPTGASLVQMLVEQKWVEWDSTHTRFRFERKTAELGPFVTGGGREEGKKKEQDAGMDGGRKDRSKDRMQDGGREEGKKKEQDAGMDGGRKDRRKDRMQGWREGGGTEERTGCREGGREGGRMVGLANSLIPPATLLPLACDQKEGKGSGYRAVD
eukprot:1156061-Pelagomonas_calceolata.AAC.10